MTDQIIREVQADLKSLQQLHELDAKKHEDLKLSIINRIASNEADINIRVDSVDDKFTAILAQYNTIAEWHRTINEHLEQIRKRLDNVELRQKGELQ